MADYIYHVAAGIFELDGGAKALCYSGNGAGKNHPGMQSVMDMGPIPVGCYRILAQTDSPTHGPDVLPLAPRRFTFTFGRGGFLIHGDSKTNPGCASQGCICMPPGARATIRPNTELLVVPINIQYSHGTGEITMQHYELNAIELLGVLQLVIAAVTGKSTEGKQESLILGTRRGGGVLS